MSQLFVSYPRGYRPLVERLVADLRSSGYEPFFDEQLAGGQLWWDELLSKIETASAFVPIIGAGYLNSTPCQLEANYAAALGKPFLPVVIEPLPPQLFSEAIATSHWVEYDPTTPTSILAVIRAINGLRPAPDLPAVMPPRPVVPISYMTELQKEIGSEEEIGRSRQIVLAADLKGRLAGPDKDAASLLLRRLRQRPDVSLGVATDIDQVLAKRTAPPAESPRRRAHEAEGQAPPPRKPPPVAPPPWQQSEQPALVRPPSGSAPSMRRWAWPALITTVIVGASAAAVLLVTNTRNGGDQPRSDPTESSVAIVPPPVGACRQLSDEEIAKQTDDSEAVDCSSVHTTETFHIGQLPELGLPYEAYDANTHTVAELATSGVARSTDEACKEPFETFVGGDQDLRGRSLLSWAWFMPSKEAWDEGARWVRCDLIATTVRLQPMTNSGRGLLSGHPSDEWMRCLDDNFGVVACSEAHTYRAVSTVVVGAPEAQWPTEGEQTKILDRECQSDGGSLMFTDGPINKTRWDFLGVRTVACYQETSR